MDFNPEHVRNMHRQTKKHKHARNKRKRTDKSLNNRQPDKQKEKRQKPWEAVKMKMFPMPQLLPPEIPKEKRLEIIRDIGTKAKKDFDASYPTIAKWFTEYDPLYLLSFCACYFVSEQEGIDREATGQLDFYHHYLEIMQAFALYQKRNFKVKPLLQNAEILKSEIEEIGKLMSIKLLSIPPNLTSDEEINAYMLRTEMMSNTTAVRNWAYVHQMKRITFDLAELIGPFFQAEYKIHPCNLLKVLWQLTEERSILLNDHLQKLRGFIKKNNYKEMIDSYNKSFPENKIIEGDDVEVIWKHAGKDRNNLIGFLICHSDLKLENIYSFTIEHAASLLEDKDSIDALGAMLSKLSYQFEEIKDFNKYHIILNNPVLHKPFIKLDDKNFFSAIWGVIPHILLDILEDFIWQSEKLRLIYTDLKAKYLEDEIEHLFIKAFPSGLIYRGSLWHDPETGKDFENDLIIIIDSFAIIVEAKSGTITDPARRGAPDRLSKTLRELIEVPSKQALRFIALLKNKKGPHTFSTKRGVKNVFDSSKINYYIPIGVTLSHLGTISSNLKKLIEAKIVEKRIDDLAPSISVTDLESIFELLPLEAEKIHYLARRREFEAHVEYDGDELDLLGFYLDNGFNIGEDEYSQDVMMFMNLKSKELDPYLIAHGEGRSVTKPELAMTKWWKDLLVTISSRKTVGWMETCFILLNTTKEDQKVFENNFEKLKKLIKKGNVEKPHNWVLFLSGHERRRYAIIGYPYTTNNKELRNTIMAQILDDEKTKQTRGIVIIGMNIERSEYPYSVLARRLSTDLFDTLSLDNSG
jgi:hypothetical protein